MMESVEIREKCTLCSLQVLVSSVHGADFMGNL